MGKDKKSADVVWFVGDYASYHPRVQLVSRALAKILNALGRGLWHSGAGREQRWRLAATGGRARPVRDAGGEERPGACASTSSRRSSRPIRTPTTPSRTSIRRWASRTRSSTIPSSWSSGSINSSRCSSSEAKKRVTYHDPCYLGRANKIYEEPRQLLQAIPGVELVEMSHNRTTSLCCGGGGGGMWLDGFQWEKAKARTTDWRVTEALAVKANTLAVACPYEPPRFEDAAKNHQGGGRTGRQGHCRTAGRCDERLGD